MANLSYEDQKALLESIDIMIKGRFDKLKLSTWIEGKVISVGEICTVAVLDTEITVKAREGLTVKEGDIVLICVPNGDYSNKYIDVNKSELGKNVARPGENEYVLPVATQTTLGGVKTGQSVSIDSNGVLEVKDNSHGHEISNISGLQEALNEKADKSYVHEQIAPVSVWDITHNLGKYPAVSIIDTAGTLVIGDVQYTSLNTIKIIFSSPFSGKAYLN